MIIAHLWINEFICLVLGASLQTEGDYADKNKDEDKVSSCIRSQKNPYLNLAVEVKTSNKDNVKEHNSLLYNMDASQSSQLKDTVGRTYYPKLYNPSCYTSVTILDPSNNYSESNKVKADEQGDKKESEIQGKHVAQTTDTTIETLQSIEGDAQSVSRGIKRKRALDWLDIQKAQSPPEASFETRYLSAAETAYILNYRLQNQDADIVIIDMSQDRSAKFASAARNLSQRILIASKDIRFRYDDAVISRTFEYVNACKINENDDIFLLLKTRANFKFSKTEALYAALYIRQNIYAYRDKIMLVLKRKIQTMYVHIDTDFFESKMNLMLNLMIKDSSNHGGSYATRALYCKFALKIWLANISAKMFDDIYKIIDKDKILKYGPSMGLLRNELLQVTTTLPKPTLVCSTKETYVVGLENLTKFITDSANYLSLAFINADATKLYTSFISDAFYIDGPDEERYIVNPCIKNLLHYIPELLVCIEMRIFYTNTNGKIRTKELVQFNDIIQKYVDLQTSYNEEKIDALENSIKTYRMIISDNFMLYSTNGTEKIHLFDLAMKLRYSMVPQNARLEKIGNIFFILAFVSEDKFLGGTLLAIYKSYNFDSHANDILKLLSKDLVYYRKYILSLQILIEYYNHIGLSKSRKMMIFAWKSATLVIQRIEKQNYFEFLHQQSALDILYDELMCYYV